MPRLSTSVFAMSAALFAAIPAYAADPVTDDVPAPAVSVSPEPLYIWSGPYAGVFLGYDWANAGTPSGSVDGVQGGGYAGFNRQSGQLVYGIEGDVGYSGATGSTAGVSLDKGLFGSLRARIGVDMNPFMLYATGGVAAANATMKDATGGSDSNTHIGWTVGAGAEAAVTDNVTARVEYRFSDFDSNTYNLPTGTISSGFDEQSVRAGIGVKF